MAGFPLCNECLQEYLDPASRRFHAQPVCCPRCGPRLSLVDATGCVLTETDPVAAALRILSEGKILAIKGIGGFHLACMPDSREAVARLRLKKHRERKAVCPHGCG